MGGVTGSFGLVTPPAANPIQDYPAHGPRSGSTYRDPCSRGVRFASVLAAPFGLGGVVHRKCGANLVSANR